MTDGPNDDGDDGGGGGTLLASCWEDDDGPARVDVVSRRDGKVVRTITDGHSLPALRQPCQPCRGVTPDGRDLVLVPDLQGDCVFSLDLSSGRLLDTLTGPELRKPTQAARDGRGNVYVVSHEGRCVLVRRWWSPGVGGTGGLGGGGEGGWRRLLHGGLGGPGGEHVLPWALSLTGPSGLVVSWMKDYASPFVVIGYQLV